MKSLQKNKESLKKTMLEIRDHVGPDLYGRGSSRSMFDNFLARLSKRNCRRMTSADRGARHWRKELEESYPVMGLTSLEVEREPSYEGLKFRSRGLLLTNFPGRFLRPKFMSTSVSRSCHVFFQVALIELYPGEKSGTRRDDI